MEMHYATILEAISDALPEEEALIFGQQRLTWTELDRRAAKLATVMSEAGIRPGDRVGLFLYNCSEYMEAMLAAMKIRAVPININFRYTGPELSYLLADAGASGLLYHESLRPVVKDAMKESEELALCLAVGTEGAGEYEAALQAAKPAPRIAREESDAFMLYTGGTTGMPKGVVYEMGNMTAALGNLISKYLGLEDALNPEAMVARAVELHAQQQSFVSLPASPLMHTAGVMNGGIAMQLLGGRMVILSGRSFDADELWATVEKEQVNFMVIVGDAFARPMLEAAERAVEQGSPYQLDSLRAMVSSGVMWSADSKRRLLELADMILIDGMGATEGPMAIQITSRQNPPREGALFQALPDTRLFDENDCEIAPGSEQQGFIAIGSAMLPTGYFRDEEKTDKTFRVINGHRYGFTGDMGVLDADGSLLFLGRGSGCINTAGEKVYPEEVEEFLKSQPEVEDSLVVGIPDERFGQSVAAVVAFDQTPDDPRAWVEEISAGHLARYKVPRTMVAVESVKRGPNGKPDLTWARKMVLGED
jgi:acyl-CoA synthetase (AMP-forming)/AMP-acid ligase II